MIWKEKLTLQDNILTAHWGKKSPDDKHLLKKQVKIPESLNIYRAIAQLFNTTENNMYYYVWPRNNSLISWLTSAQNS